MPIVWKEVLCRGRQRDGRGRWFTIDDSDISKGLKNAEKMLDRGVPIPCVWEHINHEAGKEPPEAWKAWYAKNTFAHAADVRVNDRGNLDFALDVKDEADIPQLKKTNFVSPKIYGEYEDSTGGKYDGTTVTHIAATPNPVQYWQEPFTASLSDDKAIYLSFASVQLGQQRSQAMPKPNTPPARGGKQISPRLARYLSDDGGKRRKDDDDDDDGGGFKPKKGNKGDGETISGMTLDDVIDALREKGWNIPDEVHTEGELVIAIKAGSCPMPGGDELEGAPGDSSVGADGGGQKTSSAGGPPLMMSLTSADPIVRKKVAAWSKNDKKEYKSQITNLYHRGKINHKLAVAMIRELDSTELSYTDSGEVATNSIAADIAAYSKLAEWSAWKPNGTVAGGPKDLSNITGVTKVTAPPIMGTMPNPSDRPKTSDLSRTDSGSGKADDASDGVDEGTKAATDLILSFIP